MEISTLRKLEESYEMFPVLRAEGVMQPEIDAAATQLGVPFPQDYQEFLLNYGGGHAGALAVAGLRRWRAASQNNWSVIEVTKRRRAKGCPGAQHWVFFSDDGFGNPVGFDEFGHIWISDHGSCEFICIELSFEKWVRRWGLRIEAHNDQYIAQQKWPPEAFLSLENVTAESTNTPTFAP